MEKLNLAYSTKNIPIPTERSYKLQLIENTELFTKKIRWKAIFHDMKLNNKNKNNNHINNNMKDNTKNNGDGTQKEHSSRYGIKSNKCPPQVKDLIAFEEDMIDLVHQIRFRKVNSNFQRKLNKDLKTIKSSSKTLTSVDKTSNIYKLTKDEYSHLLDNAVTATYKKAMKGIEDIINKEGIQYAKQADIFERI